MMQNEPRFHPPLMAIILCCLAVVAGAALSSGLYQDPDRAGRDLLIVGYYLLTLGLGAMVFVALEYVTGAGWGIAIRRVPEAMAAIIPIGSLAIGLFLLGWPSIYPWAQASAEAGTARTPFTETWFRYPFFLARSFIYLASWLLFAYALVRTSRRQDTDGALAHTRANVRISAAFLAVFAITFWLAGHDWLMSLEPERSSTIFAVYQFAGLLESALAAIILLTALMRWFGPFRGVVTAEHAHDFGKLLFGLSTFWMYLWFCQYMLSWYVNNPEEVSYFTRRLEGGWGPFFIWNIVLNWAIPFVILLSKATKRRLGVLAIVSLVVLAGRGLDLYLEIFPAASAQPAFGLAEAGLLLGAAGLFSLVFILAFRKAAVIPIRDPFLSESLPASFKEFEPLTA
jgi:hypothetical protein